MTMHKDDENDEMPRGKYEDFAMELTHRLGAEFSLLWVQGGKRGNGLCVQHTYGDDEKPAKMRHVAKVFEYMAEWARKEAGDATLH